MSTTFRMPATTTRSISSAKSIVVLRGEDGAVRASTMSAVIAPRGSSMGQRQLRPRLVCPYHAWSYDLDGRSPACRPARFGPRYGGARPQPVEQEIWRGFVFVRSELAGRRRRDDGALRSGDRAYRFEDLLPLGRVTLRPRAVNWKNIADNYSDGLHIPVAHPGLTRLFGRSYGIEASNGSTRCGGACATGRRPTGRSASTRASAAVRPSAGRAAAAVGLLQALAERRLRHLSRPGRFHAVRAGVGHDRR